MAVVAAACGDTAGTTPTPPPTVTGTAAEVPRDQTCAGPVTPNGGGESSTGGCYYLQKYLVTAKDVEITEGVNLLDNDGINELLRRLAPEDPPPQPNGPAMNEYLSVYEITDDTDPIDFAGGTPVYVMAPAIHWSFLPGEPPNQAGLSLDPSAFDAATNLPGDPDNRVAVVDTGYRPPGDNAVAADWDWLTTGVVGLADDTDGDGHGTFVASLIRQLSPTTQVVVARAHTIDPSEIQLPTGHPVPTEPVTSSLHIVNAIEDLKNYAAENDFEYAAWNLSLGTYECPDASAAIADVVAALSDVQGTIVAAGGNSNIDTDFWPAAWPNAVGADAMQFGGETVLWNSDRNRVPPSDSARKLPGGHSYASPFAGVDLIGTNGNGDVVSWSGSSFAAAVASGLIAAGSSLTSPVPYEDVDSLRYACVNEGGTTLKIHNDPQHGPTPLP